MTAAATPASAGPPRRPGVITAVQVLLVLVAVAQAIAALLGLGALALASSVAGSFPLDEADTAELGTIRAAVVISIGFALARGVFAVWAGVAVGRRRTIARLLITLMPVLDAAVAIATTILLGAGAAEAVSTVVFVVPMSAALITLLWVPVTAKEWFGDPAASPAGPPRAASPAGPPPAGPTAPRGPARVPHPHRMASHPAPLPTAPPAQRPVATPPRAQVPARVRTQPRVTTPARGAARPTPPPTPPPTPAPTRQAAPGGRHAR